MTVVYTKPAPADLEDIIAYTRRHFPNQLSKLEDRLTVVISRIEHYPKSAVAMFDRRAVRVVPLPVSDILPRDSRRRGNPPHPSHGSERPITTAAQRVHIEAIARALAADARIEPAAFAIRATL